MSIQSYFKIISITLEMDEQTFSAIKVLFLSDFIDYDENCRRYLETRIHIFANT
jgi:hypothetical protein